MKSKTYTQNKKPSDKTQSSKFCQLDVKLIRFQNRKKKGNDFFDRSTTLKKRRFSNYFMLAVFISPIKFSKIVFAV